MFGKHRSIFLKLLVFALCFVFVISIADTTGTKAATKNTIKVVYNVKQLKKAMKAKAASSIIFRTETFDEITIPYVKKAKNKELTIFASNAKITNKSKFKNINLKNVKKYTENANGNNIYLYDQYLWDIVIMPGKTVNSINMLEYDSLLPAVTVRKGAKVKTYTISVNGSKSSKDKKTGDVKLEYEDSYLPEGNKITLVLSFDKSGRIIKRTCKNSSSDNSSETTKMEYDQNGNNTKNVFYYIDQTYTETYKYDKNDNCVEIRSFETEDNAYIQGSRYDSNNNRLESYEIGTDGQKLYSYSFTYDKNNRVLTEYSDYTGQTEKYTYDKAGRRTAYVAVDQDGNTVSSMTTEYDKNGLTKKTTYRYGENETSNDYIRDQYGNLVTMTYYYDNGVIYDAVGYFYEDKDYVYEDGFVTPIQKSVTDAAYYKKNGYTVVDSIQGLIEAIKPGAKIILAKGYYYLNEAIDNILEKYGTSYFDKNKYVSVEDVYDGKELIIENVDGLMISGGSVNFYDTSIITEPRYATVLNFKNCKNITLNSLTIGHTQSSECSGDVLSFLGSESIKLYNMDLYGCGVSGISAYDGTKNLVVYNSKIHDCSYGPVEMSGVKGLVKFVLCSFVSSYAGGYVNSDDKSFKLIFDRCVFGEGESNKWYFDELATMKDCIFSEITRYPEY